MAGDDYGVTSSTAGSVSVNGSATGIVEVANDRDWYRVTFQTGHVYQIDLEGTPTSQGTLTDPYIRGIFNASGTLMSGTTNDDAGTGYNSLLDFTVASGGTYYISAGAYSSRTGTYRLSVTDEGTVDDYGVTSSTAGSVSVNGSATGTVEQASDQDWFRVTLLAGHTYQIDLEGTPTSQGTLTDTYLRGIYNSNGTLMSGTQNDDGGTGYNSQIDFTVSTGGTFYIAAGAYSSRTGTYRLSVTDQGGVDDYGVTSSTAGFVSVNGSATGNIEQANDQDWFRVTLQSGHTYQIDLEGTPTSHGTLSDTYLRGIYNSNGTQQSGTLNDDGGTGYNSQIDFTVSTGGTFYISAGAYSSRVGTYRLSVTDQGVGDDYGVTTSTAGFISVNGSATGTIEQSGDQDWFRVTLQSGHTYQIDLEGAPTSHGTLTDTYLRGIFNINGTQQSGTLDDDGGTSYNSQIDFSVTTGGTFFISAGAYSSNTGTYRVSVTDQGGSSIDDYGVTTSTAGSVSVNGSATGTIEQANDQDWFGVTLEAGHTYRIDLEGSPTSHGTLNDTYLRGIFNNNGTQQSGTHNDDGGTAQNSQIDFAVTTGGTFFIAAGAYSSNTGSYRVSVTDITTTTVPSNGSYNISINYTGDAQYQSVFDTAVQRWEQIITANLPSVTTNQYGFIDDLLINASVSAIDGAGGILGQAGADGVRTDGSLLPYHGTMQFDSADIAVMAQQGTLQDVILHEMGHVLGISGWFWGQQGLSNGSQFTGANAVAQYRAITGNSSLNFVPVETQGGRGTAGSHWSEAVFDHELMTGYVESGGKTMPLSGITIGALDDLGYTVNYSAADSYVVPGTIITSVLSDQNTSSDLADSNFSLALSSVISPPANFSGSTHINYGDKPMVINLTPSSVKLDGMVTQFHENDIYFFETTTGNNYLVHLNGTFIKNEPVNASDIKGTINSLQFLSGSQVNESFDFGASPLDARTALQDWQGDILDGNNFIESRSVTLQNDTLHGGNGNDILVGGHGDDMLYGDSGIDTAAYNGNANSFSVKISTSGFEVQDHRTGGDGNDQLFGIEQLDFLDRDTDMRLFTGVANNSAVDLTVFIEMYIAYFNRAPDAEGLFYWGTRLSEGMSLSEIAGSFFVQPESVAQFPDPNDIAGFVNSVYSNFLGRAPDAGGFNYWVNELTTGSVSQSIFMLAIINGAKAESGSAADVAYITAKGQIGSYFSVIKGMSNVDNAKAAMALYDRTDAGLAAAKNAIDGYYASAINPEGGEFLISLVGVLDDPFAIA